MIRKINGWEADEESLNYLSSHIQIDEKILLSIENHIKKYEIHSRIVAYYKDWEDFCTDWCGIGYSRAEAKKILYGKNKFPGEFLILPDKKGIIRFM